MRGAASYLPTALSQVNKGIMWEGGSLQPAVSRNPRRGGSSQEHTAQVQSNTAATSGPSCRRIPQCNHSGASTCPPRAHRAPSFIPSRPVAKPKARKSWMARALTIAAHRPEPTSPGHTPAPHSPPLTPEGSLRAPSPPGPAASSPRG